MLYPTQNLPGKEKAIPPSQVDAMLSRHPPRIARANELAGQQGASGHLVSPEREPHEGRDFCAPFTAVPPTPEWRLACVCELHKIRAVTTERIWRSRRNRMKTFLGCRAWGMHVEPLRPFSIKEHNREERKKHISFSQDVPKGRKRSNHRSDRRQIC